jgi:hypothetical protein
MLLPTCHLSHPPHPLQNVEFWAVNTDAQVGVVGFRSCSVLAGAFCATGSARCMCCSPTVNQTGTSSASSSLVLQDTRQCSSPCSSTLRPLPSTLCVLCQVAAGGCHHPLRPPPSPQALKANPCNNKLQIGKTLTRGLGTGGKVSSTQLSAQA